MAAKKVREGFKIPFNDGKTREIFPVSIKNLRKLVTIMGGIDPMQSQMTGETVDVLLAANRIILADYEPKIVEESYKVQEAREELIANGNTDEAYELEDPLEDLLDVPSMSAVISAGMGADPNA